MKKKPFTRLYEPVSPLIYRIIRFRVNGRARTIRSGVSLAEAQGHCSRPGTRGGAGNMAWFDGYDYVRGYKGDK